MTKLLHITSGQYVCFLSSIKYDSEHPLDRSESVINYEDSYYSQRNGFTIKEYIEYYLEPECEIEVGVSKILILYSLDELEIIYD